MSPPCMRDLADSSQGLLKRQECRVLSGEQDVRTLVRATSFWGTQGGERKEEQGVPLWLPWAQTGWPDSSLPRGSIVCTFSAASGEQGSCRCSKMGQRALLHFSPWASTTSPGGGGGGGGGGGVTVPTSPVAVLSGPSVGNGLQVQSRA